MSVLSAESVMRAINYDKWLGRDLFHYPGWGLPLRPKNLEEKPAETERLMTNETIDWDAKYLPSSIYQEGVVVFPVLHGRWAKMDRFDLEVLKLPYVGCDNPFF